MTWHLKTLTKWTLENLQLCLLGALLENARLYITTKCITMPIYKPFIWGRPLPFHKGNSKEGGWVKSLVKSWAALWIPKIPCDPAILRPAGARTERLQLAVLSTLHHWRAGLDQRWSNAQVLPSFILYNLTAILYTCRQYFAVGNHDYTSWYAWYDISWWCCCMTLHDVTSCYVCVCLSVCLSACLSAACHASSSHGPWACYSYYIRLYSCY